MKLIDTKDISVIDAHRVNGEELLERDDAMSVDGILMGICLEGWLEYHLNHVRCRVEANDGFLLLPEHIFSIKATSDNMRVKVVFVRSSCVDELLAVGNDSWTVKNAQLLMSVLQDMVGDDFIQASVLSFTQEDCQDIERLMDVLSHLSYSSQETDKKEIAIQLVTVLLLIYARKAKTSPKVTRANTRMELLTQDFFKLIPEHHLQHHDVAYYAEQLCVTSKYLSSVVRSVTGRTAQSWIDQVVLFSAKSMLKGSDLNVKQIAAQLSFSCSSSFIRFFHHITGMTPREYKES